MTKMELQSHSQKISVYDIELTSPNQIVGIFGIVTPKRAPPLDVAPLETSISHSAIPSQTYAQSSITTVLLFFEDQNPEKSKTKGSHSRTTNPLSFFRSVCTTNHRRATPGVSPPADGSSGAISESPYIYCGKGWDTLRKIHPPRPDWYEEFYASVLDTSMKSYEAEIAGYKSELFANLRGKAERVVEIGIGTGPNLRYYGGDKGVQVFGVDPNKKMEKYAKSSAIAAVSSLCTYDIFRTYINPEASGKKILQVSKYVIFGFGCFMGLLAVILNKAPVSLGWMYLKILLGRHGFGSREGGSVLDEVGSCGGFVFGSP
ncbi:hypothetical protein G4B88_025389 [Cannabis sativa]|uniref:Uncharacterized protein n=1 Tax=Cannabis sativa TaxID=3483 RepID=A0A7J6HVJ0_CANSA|nr:hypothetical protein G4B88_025389 [Cannabis sativa]